MHPSVGVITFLFVGLQRNQDIWEKRILEEVSVRWKDLPPRVIVDAIKTHEMGGLSVRYGGMERVIVVVDYRKSQQIHEEMVY